MKRNNGASSNARISNPAAGHATAGMSMAIKETADPRMLPACRTLSTQAERNRSLLGVQRTVWNIAQNIHIWG
jgi:hypothetical protein